MFESAKHMHEPPSLQDLDEDDELLQSPDVPYVAGDPRKASSYVEMNDSSSWSYQQGMKKAIRTGEYVFSATSSLTTSCCRMICPVKIRAGLYNIYDACKSYVMPSKPAHSASTRPFAGPIPPHFPTPETPHSGENSNLLPKEITPSTIHFDDKNSKDDSDDYRDPDSDEELALSTSS